MASPGPARSSGPFSVSGLTAGFGVAAAVLPPPSRDEARTFPFSPAPVCPGTGLSLPSGRFFLPNAWVPLGCPCLDTAVSPLPDFQARRASHAAQVHRALLVPAAPGLSAAPSAAHVSLWK